MTHNLELVPELTDAEAHDRAQDETIAQQRAEIRTLNTRIDALATERDTLTQALTDAVGDMNWLTQHFREYVSSAVLVRGSDLEAQLRASRIIAELRRWHDVLALSNRLKPRTVAFYMPRCERCGGTGREVVTLDGDTERCGCGVEP